MRVTALSSLFSLHDRVALVTGASSGLGRRFAHVLHDAGATVVVSARRAERLEQLADELGDRVLVVPCDVSDVGSRDELIDAAVTELGTIDVLVNNAGIGRPAPAEDEPLDDWTEVVETNLTSVFHLSQLAARTMFDSGGGSIVNVSSVLGLVASAPIAQASYVASKGGVVALTRELGCQWARRGVRVNALAPGWFRSEMTDESMFEDERSMRWIRSNCPMGRAGDEGELDGALLFLASDASTYVTGQTVAVDGGWTAR